MVAAAATNGVSSEARNGARFGSSAGRGGGGGAAAGAAAGGGATCGAGVGAGAGGAGTGTGAAAGAEERGLKPAVACSGRSAPLCASVCWYELMRMAKCWSVRGPPPAPIPPAPLPTPAAAAPPPNPLNRAIGSRWLLPAPAAAAAVVPFAPEDRALFPPRKAAAAAAAAAMFPALKLLFPSALSPLAPRSDGRTAELKLLLLSVMPLWLQWLGSGPVAQVTIGKRRVGGVYDLGCGRRTVMVGAFTQSKLGSACRPPA